MSNLPDGFYTVRLTPVQLIDLKSLVTMLIDDTVDAIEANVERGETWPESWDYHLATARGVQAALQAAEFTPAVEEQLSFVRRLGLRPSEEG